MSDIAEDIISAAILHYACEAVTINFTIDEDGNPVSYSLWIQEEPYGEWEQAIEAVSLQAMYEIIPQEEAAPEEVAPERPAKQRWPTNVRFEQDWPGGRCDPQRP